MRVNPFATAEPREQGAAGRALVVGDVFLDLVFAGLDRMPAPGSEVWASSYGMAPGGIANQAVALQRLGIPTSLCAGIGQDPPGEWLRAVLQREGVDLAHATSTTTTAVTCSIAHAEDRAMVTWTAAEPVDFDSIFPEADAPTIALYLDSVAASSDGWRRAAALGSRVFADVAWDPRARWDPAVLEPLSSCHAFIPNAAEAMAYTRTETPERALHAIADRVPVAIVTLGADGAIGIDSTTGEQASVSGLESAVLDTTGAGDIFTSAIIAGSGRGIRLQHQLELAVLCSGLAVGTVTGSLAAPTTEDLLSWYERVVDRAAGGDTRARVLRERYGFLPDALRRDAADRAGSRGIR